MICTIRALSGILWSRASYRVEWLRFLRLGGNTRNPPSGDLSRPIVFVSSKALAPPTTGRIYARNVGMSLVAGGRLYPHLSVRRYHGKTISPRTVEAA